MVKQAKLFSVFMAMLLVLSVVPAFSFADAPVGLTVEYLKIDGEKYDAYETADEIVDVKRGEVLPIKLKLGAMTDVEDVQITAGLYGYKYSNYEADKVFQTTRTFDLKEGHSTTKKLELEVPVNFDFGNDEDGSAVKLRIFVADKNSISYTKSYNLNVVGLDDEDAVVIKSAYLNPSNTVMAGRAVSAQVKVENLGTEDYDDVTLIVSVPQLGIRDTETLDELDAEESETFEKVVLRFPKDTEPGKYMVEYKVKFDEYESTVKTDTVVVTPCVSTICQSKKVADDKKTPTTMVSVPEVKVVTVGEDGSAYPVSISNTADSAKAYTLSVSGIAPWGVARVDPSSVVIVPAKTTKTAFVYISAHPDAELGQKAFTLTVASEEESKSVHLFASLEAGKEDTSKWSGLSKTLEIGLIVLIIILILIGLIVGFNKLRGNDDNEDEDAKTYY